jgi:queuine/archaeosine tRNA-ribosyltransferase
LVPLKTKDILACLAAVQEVRLPDTRLHLLGVTRTDHLNTFAQYGVVSFDSTSPLRQAFKDDRDNYYTLDRTYTAIRVPQVDGNQKLMRLIAAGQISQERARTLEQRALNALKRYDLGYGSIDETLDAVVTYDNFCEPGKDHTEIYKEVLSDRPWLQCACDICKKLRYHVILFRGAERNRRRGFHNIYVFYQRIQHQCGFMPGEVADMAASQ